MGIIHYNEVISGNEKIFNRDVRNSHLNDVAISISLLLYFFRMGILWYNKNQKGERRKNYESK